MSIVGILQKASPTYHSKLKWTFQKFFFPIFYVTEFEIIFWMVKETLPLLLSLSSSSSSCKNGQKSFTATFDGLRRFAQNLSRLSGDRHHFISGSRSSNPLSLLNCHYEDWKVFLFYRECFLHFPYFLGTNFHSVNKKAISSCFLFGIKINFLETSFERWWQLVKQWHQGSNPKRYPKIFPLHSWKQLFRYLALLKHSLKTDIQT